MISTRYLQQAENGLKQRIITAVIVLAVVLTAIFFSKPLLICLVLFVYFQMQYELFSFSPQLDTKSKTVLSLFSLVLPLSYALNGFSCFVIVATFYIIVCYSFIIVYLENQKHEQLNSDLLLIPALSLSYTGLLGTILYIVASRFEHQFIIWLISISISTDTLAYFSGKYWGNKKLAPRISPGKTVVGLCGGILGALASSLVIVTYQYLPLPAYQVIFFSLLMSLLCVFGDLFESLVKRCYNIKDSGKILPGHGGVLDRVDALIFAAPVLLIVEYLLY